MNARQYRDYLYRTRAHPEDGPDEIFIDRRDSFLTVYLSIIPFLLLEYFSEAMTNMPSGIVFPLGYLLFWSYYYTFYKPNVLEEHLTAPKKWNFSQIPTTLIGLAIWFVKVTILELSKILVLNLFMKPHGSTPPNQAKRTGSGKVHRQSSGNSQQTSHAPQNHSHSSPRREDTTSHVIPFGIPTETREALYTLGLREGASWSQIQHRFRELAKRYHPDLNPEITSAGRRFIMYDSAYRKLAALRARDSFGKKGF